MLTFTLNGKKQSVDVAPDTPLLWVIRDTLKLTGTKYSCGKGLCGSCTVHVDGKPRKSCNLPVSKVEGKTVLTIEGLGKRSLHPVQKAWIEDEVAQCGYCQPGQIMTAVALLEDNAHPNDADIEDAMKGILCRCGTYQRIKKAIHTAAKEA
ncbi:MAG: (2Fe-2S)-binding protein [Candidatus Marinimicrobia bacterium]|nr:(2Fe-2S)-binding protein [Candidatus Neomarinimicrobiota bacterium]MBT3576478.1 (2Fe-2S)-binding protein [Candidatus Neomarinimicrobiota bacterium]MBT3681264.1 (2Fe-2S)-binding protein [Candidatus Neomarinimicrobiota bacterium]MBT4130851.1 (2Fe-2S)-binding protein [Candidatus Neomarinimicrobiota bacterium]MBT4295876.1 (2Fe-2S)-binding protein [Candidatus Neomarinimicrobiota bacterium]